ncbi:MAG: hypothetical protein ABIP94_00965, partial [Planctomycetota bacterium]
AAGERGDVAGVVAAPKRNSSLALAGLFLLGLGVVFGVFWFERSAQDKSATAPQEPVGTMLEVTSREAIARLPKSARAVELFNLDDAAVAELVQRCPDLEHLRIATSTLDPPIGLCVVSITDAALPAIGKLSRLRALEVIAAEAVRGTQLSELEQLPLLERLTFSGVDLEEQSLQVLPRLPSLRELRLDCNRPLDGGAIAVIARCPGLRVLRLRGTSLPGPDAFAPLEKLHSLVELDLGGINSPHRAALSVPKTFFDDGDDGRLTEKAKAGSGSGERLKVGALQAWSKLQRIALAHSPDLEAGVGDVLRKNCPDLRDVDLSHCALVDDTTVASLLGSRTLRRLNVAYCPKVSAFCLPLLMAAEQLCEVDLSDAYWFTLEQAEQMLASGKRVTCFKQQDGTFNRALAALQAKYAESLAVRSVKVGSQDELESLPVDVTHIEVRGLGDRAAAWLGKRGNLVGLQFLGDDKEPFTDAGLASLARLSKLEVLELSSLRRVTGEGLVQLAANKALRVVRWLDVPADDRALAILPQLPKLCELALTNTQTFGGDGVRSIAQCKGLTQLELSFCTQLTSPWLAELGALTSLESLGLARLPGFDDAAFLGLRSLTNLRELNVRKGAFTDQGLRAIEGMRHLQMLNLGENTLLKSASLFCVPPSVRSLMLNFCVRLDGTAGSLLRDRFPTLTHRDVGCNEWVDDDVLATILQAPKLEQLIVRLCARPTAASYAAILAARSLRQLHATNCPCLTDELEQQLARERPELKVTRKNW